MGISFIRPERVRLHLADVHRRNHEALTKRTKPRKASPLELAASLAAIAVADKESAWIDVKRRLNTGEQREMQSRMYQASGDSGRLRLDLLATGVAMVTAYLLDWSATDTPIAGLSVEELTQTLNALDPTSFGEIRQAIEWHIAAMEEERSAEKNVRAGETNASAISPSPSEPAGASTGSVN